MEIRYRSLNNRNIAERDDTVMIAGELTLFNGAAHDHLGAVFAGSFV